MYFSDNRYLTTNKIKIFFKFFSTEIFDKSNEKSMISHQVRYDQKNLKVKRDLEVRIILNSMKNKIFMPE